MDEFLENIKESLNKNMTVRLKIKVCANAKQNSIEQFEDVIKIKINKPAVDGKANKAIIEYLSVLFNVPKTNISILKGEKSSLKDLQIIPKSHIIKK